MIERIFTVTLNPAIDKTLSLDRYSKKKRTYSNVITSAGGKGFNVSRALKCLNVSSYAYGLAGGETGRKLKRMLSKEGISLRLISVEGESRTNITFQDRLTQNRLRIMGHGPRVNRDTLIRFERTLLSQLTQRSTVILAGRLAEGVSDDYYAVLIRKIRKRTAKIVLDTSGKPFLKALKEKPYIIKPNLKEAEEVLGRKLTSKLRIIKAAQSFLRRGVQTVLLTLGAQGAIGARKGLIFSAQAPKVASKNEIGCGDAFLAGFLCAEKRGHDFADALRFAVSCGSINCLNNIPGKVDQRKIPSFFNKVRIKRL